MRIGMIGLGRMGANMVRRLLQGGHECVAHDPRPEAVRAAAAQGAQAAHSLAELVRLLAPPRAGWIMGPAPTGRSGNAPPRPRPPSQPAPRPLPPAAARPGEPPSRLPS